MKNEKFHITGHKGQLPGDTSWWSSKDWEEHRAYIEELKAKGEYGDKFEYDVTFQRTEPFDAPNSTSLGDFSLAIPKGGLRNGDVKIPKFDIRHLKLYEDTGLPPGD